MNYREIKTLKGQIKHCLEAYQETRNSDLTLMIKVWEVFYSDFLLDGAVPLKALYELPREDSVKRLRAMFTAKGLYYPTTWEVAKARAINEDEWRVAVGCPVKNEIPEQKPSYIPPSFITKVLTFNSKRKPDRVYSVAVADEGITCDCESFKHRAKCSHVRQTTAEMVLKFQPKLI